MGFNAHLIKLKYISIMGLLSILKLHLVQSTCFCPICGGDSPGHLVSRINSSDALQYSYSRMDWNRLGMGKQVVYNFLW